MTEYRCHGTHCSCSHFNTIQLPEDVATSNFGRRYMPLLHPILPLSITSPSVAWLKSWTHFSILTCNSALPGIWSNVSPMPATPSATPQKDILQSPYLNADETGWKNKGQRRWLWAFVADICVVCVIAASRGSKVIKNALGKSYVSILCSDDFSAYSAYHKNGIRQLCWAHLIRKLKGLKDFRSSPDAYRFSTNMLGDIGRLFSYWHAFLETEGTIREELWLATELIRGRIKRQCNHYMTSKDCLRPKPSTLPASSLHHLSTSLCLLSFQSLSILDHHTAGYIPAVFITFQVAWNTPVNCSPSSLFYNFNIYFYTNTTVISPFGGGTNV